MQEKMDHFTGSEIFDLNLKKKISYSKIVPYRHAIISPPYVDDTTYKKILEYQKIFNDVNIFDYLKTWYTANQEEILGYTISPSIGIPYSECNVLGAFYNSPENLLLKMLHENKYEIYLIGNYFEKGGNGKYVEFILRDIKTLDINYFSELEKYNDIKSLILQNTINKFSPIFLIDLQDEKNFGMNIDTFFISSDNNNTDIFFNRDESYYLNLKKQYYQNFVNAGILSQDQYDYIFEVSPGAERTILKFRWEESKLTYMELESICVFEFNKVWTRT